MKKILITMFMLMACSTASAESLLKGKKALVLFSAEEQALVIGEIQFTPADGKTQYKINLDSDLFINEFLSMRPFQCIHQDNKMLCHLAYPYELQGYITENDLTDLEYDLLFLHKGKAEYGIDAWNGLYYQLEVMQDKLSGTLHEVDLNVLVAPPEEGVLRPITDDMLHNADPAQHMFSRIEIK